MPLRIRPGGPFLVGSYPPDNPQYTTGPQGSGFSFRIQPPLRGLVATVYDEEIVSQGITIVDEDGGTAGAAGTWKWTQPAFLSDLDVWVPSISVDEDYQWTNKYYAYPVPKQGFISDDEIVPQAAIAVVDDDAAFIVQTTPWVLSRLQPVDDEAWVASIGIDEEYVPGPWRTPQRAFQPGFASDEDSLPIFGIDDDAGIIGQVVRAQPFNLPFIADDEIVSQPDTIVDEDAGVVGYVVQAQPYALPFLVDDDFVPYPFGLDEDFEWHGKYTPFLPPLVGFFADEDTWPTPFVPPVFDRSIKYDITTGMLVKPLAPKIVMSI